MLGTHCLSYSEATHFPNCDCGSDESELPVIYEKGECIARFRGTLIENAMGGVCDQSVRGVNRWTLTTNVALKELSLLWQINDKK